MDVEAFFAASRYGSDMEHAVRYDIAAFGELIADPSRVAILLALVDGTMRPASELARAAGITAATASTHLARLVKGGLLAVEPMGRHRFYKVASTDVANAFESLMSALPTPSPKKRLTREPTDLVRARTCYGHLAGVMGVQWLASLTASKLIDVDAGVYALTKRGIEWLEKQQMHEEAWPTGKACLDWTERRYHLGGPLGVKLTDHLVARRWLAKKKESRVLRITADGERELARLAAYTRR